METVDDTLRTRESVAAYAVHAVCQIKRYLCHSIATAVTALMHAIPYLICPKHQGYDRALTTVCILVVTIVYSSPLLSEVSSILRRPA